MRQWQSKAIHGGAMVAAMAGICGGCAGDDSGGEPPIVNITVSGNAFSFSLPGQPYGRIEGAEISVLEQPGAVTETEADGYFELALPPGSEATFVMIAGGFPEAQTGTFTLPSEADLERVTFQIPDNSLLDSMAAMIQLTVDDTKCQLVSTVTVAGKSIYDPGAHGEAGATVSAEPALGPEHGPIYFNDAVIPTLGLTETSSDGGVLFTNVPPGTYLLAAHKDGVDIAPVTMKCRPNVLVNASPPYGLQAQ